MISETGDDESGLIDAEAALESVREAWLNTELLAQVDAVTGGAYAFDPSDVVPVSVVDGGQRRTVFART